MEVCVQDSQEYLVSQLKGVVGLNSNSQHILVAIDDRVGNGGQCGVVQLQGNSCNLADGGGYMAQQVIIIDVQDLGIKYGASLNHLKQSMASSLKPPMFKSALLCSNLGPTQASCVSCNKALMIQCLLLTFLHLSTSLHTFVKAKDLFFQDRRPDA